MLLSHPGQSRIIQHMKKLLTPGQTENVACKSHRKKRKKFSLSQLPQFFYMEFELYNVFSVFLTPTGGARVYVIGSVHHLKVIPKGVFPLSETLWPFIYSRVVCVLCTLCFSVV